MESRRSLTVYFIAGFYGALILIAIMYIMMMTEMAGNPGFVNTYHAVFGEYQPVADHAFAAVLFAISGGIWGMVFRIVPKPTSLKGMAFGILPSLLLWVVVVPVTGGPIFNGFAIQGLLLPLVFNCIIWGSFTGWYVRTSYE